MTKVLKLKTTPEEGIIDFARFLLENKKVNGVFTLKKTGDNGAVSYALITDAKELADAVPLYPLMPVNAGSLLSRFTLRGHPAKPVVAILRPCELRAFIELVKREQGSLENMFLISVSCGGVYPLALAADGDIEKNLTMYWDAIKKQEIPANIRPACASCTEFMPYTADITIDLIGTSPSDKNCLLILNTKKGEQLAKGASGEILEHKTNPKKIAKLREKRQQEKQKLFSDIDSQIQGLDNLVKLFGRCIGCHGCSRVCPICYCKLCEFDSVDSEYTPSNYESELKRRGALKVPPGTVYYQLGRLTHVGISCVGCGSCEDACPVDIPLSLLFKKVGESIQEMFDYIPGKNVDEKLPLTTFNQDELAEVEE